MHDIQTLSHLICGLNQVTNFEMVKLFASGVNLYESRIFLEGIYTKLQPASLNEAMTVPPELLFIDI